MMITPRLPSNFVNMLRSKSLHVYGEEWILDYEEFSDGHQDSSRSIRPYLWIFVPLPTSVTTGVTMFYIFPSVLVSAWTNTPPHGRRGPHLRLVTIGWAGADTDHHSPIAGVTNVCQLSQHYPEYLVI